jgi:hypothetical protein
MRGLDRRAVLTNGITAAAVTIGAATMPAKSQPSAPLSAPAVRSPRARLLLDLYLRIDALYVAETHSGQNEEEINAAAREVYALMDDIEASPGTGLVALEEYAAGVLYWYRSRGFAHHENCPVTLYVLALVTAAQTVAAGGANG